VTTDHFGLTWEDGDATTEQAERAAAALEAAWTELVDTEGWPAPVSSDQWLLWVILVDDISGTGYTTEYTTPEYPSGYPVIYLNSTTAGDEGFWRALASHEFHHAIQYAMRDYGAGAERESWYWEASATWASTLVEPETESTDYVAAWYTDNSTDRYTSTDGYHHYGMFVFNAWLDTAGVTPPGTMQRIWTTGTGMGGENWRTIIQAATGLDASYLWSAFAADLGADNYGRATSWRDPSKEKLVDGRSLPGQAGELGTAYYFAPAEVDVEVTIDGDGEVAVTGVGSTVGEAGRMRVPAGGTLTVTTVSANVVEWTLTVSAPANDTGEADTGEDDTGEDDTGEDDTGEDDAVAEDTANPSGPANDDDDTDTARGCACATGSGASGATLTGAFAAWALRRRRR
jgi:MYXO-CTERM domain-containing protein